MNDIFSFLLSPDFKGGLLIVKIIFLIFSLILLIFIGLALFRTSWFKYFIITDLFEFFTYRPFGVKKITKQWLKIMKRLEAGSEAEVKLAVIEADSLLDEILKRMDYSGETLEDKLKSITKIVIPNIEEVRQVHQIRDNIVHDPDYKLSLDEAKKVLGIYEKALRDLEVI